MPASWMKTRRQVTPCLSLSHSEVQLHSDPYKSSTFLPLTMVIRHRLALLPLGTIARVTPDALTRSLHDFLADASGAVVLEDGAVAFDLERARYSVSGEYNKCLLHLWSAERNTIRRVLDAEVKNGTLRLAVQRLGQTRPTKLEICRERDRRSPSAKKAARASYEQKLRRGIGAPFPRFHDHAPDQQR